MGHELGCFSSLSSQAPLASICLAGWCLDQPGAAGLALGPRAEAMWPMEVTADTAVTGTPAAERLEEGEREEPAETAAREAWAVGDRTRSRSATSS